jgi:hypothetical protein
MPFSQPRFGVLPLAPDGRNRRYVVYDRLTQRITNGVYLVLGRVADLHFPPLCAMLLTVSEGERHGTHSRALSSLS